MSVIKISEQIAFLRRQKGITQEQLAQALGVTNQSVSKWKSGTCCPDIQLLPDIAAYFGVSTDELLGYKPADTFGDISLKIKALFERLRKKTVLILRINWRFYLRKVHAQRVTRAMFRGIQTRQSRMTQIKAEQQS